MWLTWVRSGCCKMLGTPLTRNVSCVNSPWLHALSNMICQNFFEPRFSPRVYTCSGQGPIHFQAGCYKPKVSQDWLLIWGWILLNFSPFPYPGTFLLYIHTHKFFHRKYLRSCNEPLIRIYSIYIRIIHLHKLPGVHWHPHSTCSSRISSLGKKTFKIFWK